jgi:hypothetical protein
MVQRLESWFSTSFEIYQHDEKNCLPRRFNREPKLPGCDCWQLLLIDHQNGFQANSRKIFSMDECGLKMNEEPGKVVSNDGSSRNFRGEWLNYHSDCPL